jgi:hypothetical protein
MNLKTDDQYTHHQIPKQKIPPSKKNEDWGKRCVEAYISLSDIGGFSTRRGHLTALYDFYNGHILEEDYTYVLKPYGKARRNFPSKIRNYPIIKPVVDLLLGEKAKRPINYTVAVANADSVSKKEEQKKAKIMQAMQQRFVNKLNETQGAPSTNTPSKETQLPQHIAEMFESSYVDKRASIGQNSLSYLLFHQNVHHKFQKAWFHFLISGEAYTHRGVNNNEVFYDVLNPMDVDYDKDPDVDFIEDGDWALVRKDAHVSTIIDLYREFLSAAEMDQLENPAESHDGTFLVYGGSPDNDRLRGGRSRLIEVITVYWKSISKIGFLEYPDPETGDMETVEVPGEYKMPAELKKIGATILWDWVPEVWEGTRIGDDIFVKIGPTLNQRRSLNNPGLCKLPINGIKYSEINSDNVSLVQLGVPYQINYNIYKYRLEIAIAKSKDIIAQFDINMIPKKWDMDKFMYYIDAIGIAWVDYNKEGIQLNPQHQTVMDLSIKTIQQYVVLLESILQEWERLSGVNRQRQGQTGEYEGKGITQQAIMQSSHITEDYFRKISTLEEKDMQAMLDYSKVAWVAGKKTSYVMPDGTVEYLAVNPLDHMESEYGIFVTDAGQDIEKKQKVEALAQSMIQNGVPASIVAEAIDSDSFTQIKEKISKAEKITQQLEQAQQKAQNEIAQKQVQVQQDKMAFDADQNDKDRATQIEVALIQAEANDLNSHLKNALEQAEIQRKSKADDSKSVYEKGKLAVDHKKIDADVKMNTADNKVEKEKIAAMVKAKQNAPKQ